MAGEGLGGQAVRRHCRRCWRPRPELNRGTRFCRPLRHHSATWPKERAYNRSRPETAIAPHATAAGGVVCPLASPSTQSPE